MQKNSILKNADILLKSLSGLIDIEQKAIMEADNDSLDEIVKRKKLKLEELSILEPSLILLFNRANNSKQESTQIEALKARLVYCREINDENNKLSIQRINTLDRSVAFIEGLMNISSVRTYGPSGKTDSKPSMRKIGLA
jgi:hypothetical protein